MLLAVFLPLVLLGLFTTETAGSLAFFPLGAGMTWMALTAFGLYWLLPSRLHPIVSRDRFQDLLTAQDRLPWILAGWTMVLQAFTDPLRLVFPGLDAVFPQAAPLLVSTIVFLALLTGCSGEFHKAFQRLLAWDQTRAEYLRARLAPAILLFPPLLVGATFEDLIGNIVILPGLADLPLLIMAPLFCLALYLFSPHLFNWAWQAEPLLDHPNLRASIQQLSAQTGTPIAGIRIWNTFQEPIPNAAVVGLIPAFRYIYLTKYLLDSYPENEQLVIVAHELGHFRLGHVWTYLWFTLVLIFLTLASRLILFLHWPKLPELFASWGMIFEFLGFFGIFLLVFTALSRHGEHQADLFASLMIGRAEMTEAMSRLQSEIRPTSRRMPWWIETHPPFTRRIEVINSWSGEFGDLARAATRLRAGMMAVILAGGLLLMPTISAVWEIGMITRAVDRSTAGGTMRAPKTASRNLAGLENRLADLERRFPGHPLLEELQIRISASRGRWGEAAWRWILRQLEWPAPEIGRPSKPGRFLEILQHPAAPEVALHLDIVQFLLQPLDLRGVHGIPLFDQ